MRVSTYIGLLICLLLILSYYYFISKQQSIQKEYIVSVEDTSTDDVINLSSGPWFGERRKSFNLLDSMNFTCQQVLQGTKGTIDEIESNSTINIRSIENDLLYSINRCERVNQLFNFPTRPKSEEERLYPLAYGILSYKNIVQLLFMLSSFYQPQNVYCLAVGQNSDLFFRSLLEDLSKCWPNVYFLPRPEIKWGGHEIINSVYSCLEFMSNLKNDWKYFQYLSGFDAPLKTNLEMVRIFKALNETPNFEITDFQPFRLKDKKASDSPLPLFKSSLSALIPRKAANQFSRTGMGRLLIDFLRDTQIADEGFWATLMGNKKIFNVTGSIDGIEWLEAMKKPTTKRKRPSKGPGHDYYISRHQVWVGGSSRCGGYYSSGSCVYGISDLPSLLASKRLVAHKFYIEKQPAAFFCLLKEIRRRSDWPDITFDMKYYETLPHVELNRGVAYANLTNPPN